MHVQVSGKWTKELAEKLFVEYKPIHHDYSEGTYSYLFGAGIGQTSFASMDEDQRVKCLYLAHCRLIIL